MSIVFFVYVQLCYIVAFICDKVDIVKSKGRHAVQCADAQS